MQVEGVPLQGAGRVVGRLARQLEVALAELDLTLPQYRIMSLLDDGSAAASKLADALAVRRPTVTAVVDGLVERGLLQRSPDPTDRRRVDHRLTPAGRALLATADLAVDGRLAAIAAAAPGTAAEAIAALGAWRVALEAARDARVGAGG